jgi:biotin synthase-related radical SAM superfamily protein
MECLGNNISPTPFQNFNIFPKGERIKEEMKRANKNLKKKIDNMNEKKNSNKCQQWIILFV